MEREPTIDFRIRITPKDVARAVGSLLLEKIHTSSEDNNALSEPVFCPDEVSND
jgi:hypothetical protein